MHLRLSFQLGCSLARRGKHIQYNVKRGHILKTLCSKWGHHTIHPLCSCIWVFLVYNHCNHESGVINIPFVMGTHQGDLSRGGGGGLFVLAHCKALCFTISHFPSCLFPSIAYERHIIGPLSIVSCAYEHLKTKLYVIGFFIQP